MGQLDSFIALAGLVFAGLLLLLLSLRSTVRSLRRQLSYLTAEVHKLRDQNQTLSKEVSVLTKSPTRNKQKPAGRKAAATLPPPRLNESESKEIASPKFLEKQPESHAIQIVTRTTKQDGKTLDSWSSEREWTQRELETLLDAYREGRNLSFIAVQLGADAKDVVYAVARHAFNCKGDLEDLTAAPNHGKKWLTEDAKRMKLLLEEGVEVSDVAFRLGRTQLAIIWRLLV